MLSPLQLSPGIPGAFLASEMPLEFWAPVENCNFPLGLAGDKVPGGANDLVAGVLESASLSWFICGTSL